MSLLDSQIAKLLKEVGIKETITLTVPPKPEMGDLAFACFDLAREQNKNPGEVAKELVEKLSRTNNGLVQEIKAFGPYVNFYLNNGKLAELILKEVNKKNFGGNNLGRGKKVMIEYPSQNTHKEFHIGHLRNVCIGNTLVQLYNKCGYKMIPVNYINDFGSHVAKCLWYIKKFNKVAPKDDKQKWLGEMYAEASQYLADKEELKSELDEFLLKLEKRDKEIWRLFVETRKWSLAGFKKIDQELAVKYEKIFLESEVKDKGQKMVDELLKRKVAEVGERGAVIVDLKKYGLDVALIRKSSGAGVYFTSDFALAVEKFKKIKVEESINITGTEQNFYFKQLFKILELYGFKNKLVHLGYGLVNLPEGKMSSRTGRVILYEDLREQLLVKMQQETKKRHSDWPEKKIKTTANTLAMAALKFTMQKHEAAKNITFDINEAVSFEGFSSSYILYVVARINSLEKKAKIKFSKIDYQLLNTPEEKKLLLLLAEYGEMVVKALTTYNPSVLTKYAFDLAKVFNEFYNKETILADDNKLTVARLVLAQSVRKVLISVLNLLTIKTVEEM